MYFQITFDEEELRSIMSNASESYNSEVRANDDGIDALINEIIKIEKAHKHISQGGTTRKHEQITKKINKFLGYDNLEARS